MGAGFTMARVAFRYAEGLMNWLLPLLALLGCSHAPLPGGPAEAFADALEAGRLDEAWDTSTGLLREAFEARYATQESRRARAAQVRRALEGKGDGVGLLLVSNRWRVVEAGVPIAVDGPDEALNRFLAAVEAADWSTAWSQLSATWRGRYTPEGLGKDFESEPLVRDRLARAKAAGRTQATVESDRARFPIAEGKAVRLVLEAGAWKVDALE
jgi:hypothetical protein